MSLPPETRPSQGPVDAVARAAWSRAAGRYLEHCRRDVNWNKMVEIPAMRQLLGDARGKRTLEVGCGPAHYSTWLAQQGAEAWGFDPAPDLVEAARRDAAEAGVELSLRIGGVELLSEYRDTYFDIVLFPMVLEYLDDLPETFRQAARILKPDGLVAISIVHPVRHFSVHHDAEDGTEMRLVANYLRRGVLEWSGWVMQDDEGNDVQCKSHCRTIEDHVEALVGAGSLVEAIKEPMAIPEAKALAPRIYEGNAHCPQFMLVKAVKDPRRC